MALGRLIAKALLEGKRVRIDGFGTFSRQTPTAAVHDHEQHRIWTGPRDEIRFEPADSVGNGLGSPDGVRHD